MVLEAVAKGLVALGALALVIGPMLQAVSQLRVYKDLAAQAGLTQAAQALIQAVGLDPQVKLPSTPREALKQLVGFESLQAMVNFYKGAGKAIKFFVKREYTGLTAEDQKRLAAALRTAGVWYVIGVGSIMIFVGATIDLVKYVVEISSVSATGMTGTH